MNLERTVAGTGTRRMMLVAAMLGLAGGVPPLAVRAAAPVESLLEIRQRNVVTQEWDLSCGAASLATLLRYQHADLVTERDVAVGLMQRPAYLQRPELVRLREGFSFADLKRYAEGRGYQGVGLGGLSLDDLTRRAPILVPISRRGYNHFVLFRGRTSDRVLLADPAWGNRTMTVQQFERAWRPYPEVGRVGFVVLAADGKQPGSPLLAPRADEFVTFN